MKTLDPPAGSLSLLERAMDLRSFRNDLIAGNIANMDTPNYRSFDVAMAAALDRIDDGDAPMEMARSHPSHLTGNDAGLEAMPLYRTPPRPYSLKGDGNTVDIDTEMVKLAENSLMYHALTQITTKEFQLFTTAIEGK